MAEVWTVLRVLYDFSSFAFCVCPLFGAMAYGSTSVVSTASVDELDIVGYNDFFVMTLQALQGDSAARKGMTECIAMQHSTILKHVAEFLGTDMAVFKLWGIHCPLATQALNTWTRRSSTFIFVPVIKFGRVSRGMKSTS